MSDVNVPPYGAEEPPDDAHIGGGPPKPVSAEERHELAAHVGHIARLLATSRDRAQVLADSLHVEQSETTALRDRVAYLEDRVSDRDHAVEYLQEQITVWEQHWDATQRTLSWRAVQSLRRARRALFPGGTARERVWRRSLSVVKWAARPKRATGGNGLAVEPFRAATPGLRHTAALSLIPPGSEFIRFASDNDIDLTAENLGDALGQNLASFLESNGRLRFRPHLSPDVSIVIPTLNQAAYTLGTLQALHATASEATFEVVVVENASTDETARVLERVENVLVLRNDENVGFGEACNRGVENARGRYIWLLNSDAMPAQTALDALVAAIEAAADIGAVGGKLVLPDGQLQEAGSIVWPDGSTAGYGRGADPSGAEFAYPRRVDYCSAASLLVDRSLFLQVGGFDARYSPAYYEDVDLCMELRRAGRVVRYEPDAEVLHLEHGSGSRASAVHLQTRNRSRFAAKWRADLRSQAKPGPVGAYRARDRRIGKRILVVDDRVPENWIGSGFPRTRALLDALTGLDAVVTYLPVTDPRPHQPTTRELQRQGIEVLHSVGNVQAEIARRGELYDAVIVSRPHNAWLLQVARNANGRATMVYDAEAIVTLRDVLRAEVEGRPLSPLEVESAVQSELAAVRGADAVLTVTERERDIFAAHWPHVRSEVWGQAAVTRRTEKPFEQRAGTMFVGYLGSDPNNDAALRLIRDIMPRVQARINCDVTVVGAGASADLAQGFHRLGRGSRLAGYVDDLRPVFDAHRVFVAPHQYAAGLPIKVVEAMANGVPSVVSSLLAQQLGVTDEVEALVATTSDEFAMKIADLHQSAELWVGVQQRAYEFVEQNFNPSVLRDKLAEVLNWVDNQQTDKPLTSSIKLEIPGPEESVENEPPDVPISPLVVVPWSTEDAFDYETWMLTFEPDEEARARQLLDAFTANHGTRVTVVLPVCGRPAERVKSSIEAVLNQTYHRWELLLCGGESDRRAITELCEEAADARVSSAFVAENLPLAELLNRTIALSGGDLILVVSPGDQLAPSCFFEMARARTKDVSMLYADEDVLENDGLTRTRPFLKPDWSPDMLLSLNYLGHAAVTRDLFERSGGFAGGAEGALLWDFLLRASERAESVAHIPAVLYHNDQRNLRRGLAGEGLTPEAQCTAVERHLDRLGIAGATADLGGMGTMRVRWPTSEPLVSIIIPTKNHADLLRGCLESLALQTKYQKYEVIIVDNGSTENAVTDLYAELADDPRIHVLPFHEQFNYSGANNLGAEAARGELLLFLNNDVTIIDEGWLKELVRWAQRPGVGAVGAKLLYPDRSVQHAGVILGMGLAGHVFAGAREDVIGPYGTTGWYRDFLALTAACLMLRRDRFEAVGGFDETYQVAYGDVDLCLRLVDHGYRNVYNPFARIIHHESASRGEFTPQADSLRAYELMVRFVEHGDPYFNRNLSRRTNIPSLRDGGQDHFADTLRSALGIIARAT